MAVISVSNMIPSSMSNEIARDSEPNVAVDLSNPLRLAASAFTPDPMSSGTAPIWVSTDGGGNWVLNVCVPGGLTTPDGVGGGNQSRTGDITLRFASASGVLYTGILRKDNGDMDILRKADFTLPGVMTTLLDRATEDQPWVTAATVMGGSGAGNDRIYVGHNDLNQFAGTGGSGDTAASETSLNSATAPAPAGLTERFVDPRSTCGQDGPSIRPAIHPNGTIYAAYFRWTAGCGGAVTTGDVVVARDDGWASGGSPFTALIDPDTLAGRRVATGVSFPFTAVLGTQRIGSQLAIAVDPRDSRTVYVAWCDGTSAANYTLHVRRSTNSGANWTADLRTITQATNPGLAINSRGKVGLLYQQLGNPGSGNRWRTHFETTTDGFASAPTDLTLADVPDQNGPYTGANPIGDYACLVSAGKDFYGIFSANNTPDNANFPQGVTYKRNANFTTNTLLDASSNPVQVSIDPFFFKSVEVATEDDFYVRDWTDSASSGDNGLEPSTHPQFYTTSDVWNRRGTLPGPFPSDQPSNEDAGNGSLTVGDNWAFARIRRNAPAASGPPKTVTAHFLVSKFGTGSSYVDAGSGDPDVSFPDPDPTVTFQPPDVGPFITPAYHWHLNSVSSIHLCLAVEISGPNDPFVAPSLVGNTPGWPTTDLRIVNDNNKAQRNMGLSTTPARGVGMSDSFYALIHNAATRSRDLVLRFAAPPETVRRLKGATIEVIGGRNVPLRPDGSLTLKGMAPGENRWIGLTFPAPRGDEGEIVGVQFLEMVGNEAVNGFDIGARPASIDRVIRERLELHRSVFERLAAGFEMPGAAQEAAAVQRLLARETVAPKEYTAFLARRLAAIAEMQRKLLASHKAGDPFRVVKALTALRKAAKAGRTEAVAVAHSALLNKLDSYLTMLQLEQGDSADILQNVRWQRHLYRTLPALEQLKSAKALVRRSSEFMAAYGERKIGNDEFPDLIKRSLDAFRETATAVEKRAPGIAKDVERMEASLDRGHAALQKAHRGFLLKLDGLVGKRRGARTSP
jgi:hypothetical protein